MANSCSNLEFLKGGTIDESTIMHSEIVSSVVSNSTIQTSEIKQLADIDAASATTITNRIVENVTNIRNISNAVAADEASYQAVGEKIVTDDVLVRLLVQTLTALPVSVLAPLAESLAASLNSTVLPAEMGASPVKCKEGVLPGALVGNDTYLLGAPTSWVQTADGDIPVYPHNPCEVPV